MGIEINKNPSRDGSSRENYAEPQNKADYEVLPSGAWYKHPEAGDVRRKK